jgi:hypothetical protein
LSEKTKIITDKILNRTSEVGDSTKREIKVKIEEYEKTPRYQTFLRFQKFTADQLAPIFKEVDGYLSILSSRFVKLNGRMRNVAACNK